MFRISTFRSQRLSSLQQRVLWPEGCPRAHLATGFPNPASQTQISLSKPLKAFFFIILLHLELCVSCPTTTEGGSCWAAAGVFAEGSSLGEKGGEPFQPCRSVFCPQVGLRPDGQGGLRGRLALVCTALTPMNGGDASRADAGVPMSGMCFSFPPLKADSEPGCGHLIPGMQLLPLAHT